MKKKELLLTTGLKKRRKYLSYIINNDIKKN